MVAAVQYSLLYNAIETLNNKKQGIINLALISKNIIYAEKAINDIAETNNLTSLDSFNSYLQGKFTTVSLEDFNLSKDNYSSLLYLSHKDKKMDRKYYKILYRDNKFYLKEIYF